MKIRSVTHRGLRRLIEHDDMSELQVAFVGKFRKIIAFLQDMDEEDELRSVPAWKAHQLSGDSAGDVESLRQQELADHVPDQTEIEIVDLNYDYH